jgi:tRNA(fMet)-specific endonuclease VapC
MPGSKYLLDTNIIVAYFQGETQVIAKMTGADILTNSTVMGEMSYGAYNSTRIEQNLEQLEHFKSFCIMLPCDDKTSGYYGQIKHELKKAGRPIPENDIWIAASARQHGLILVTRDQHFSAVERLQIERW